MKGEMDEPMKAVRMVDEKMMVVCDDMELVVQFWPIYG